MILGKPAFCRRLILRKVQRRRAFFSLEVMLLDAMAGKFREQRRKASVFVILDPCPDILTVLTGLV
jgi:hypothetical protein